MNNISVSSKEINRLLSFLNKENVNVESLLQKSKIDMYEIKSKSARISLDKYILFNQEINEYPHVLDNFFSSSILREYYNDYPELFSLCLNEKNAFNAIDVFVSFKNIINSCSKVLITGSDFETKYVYQGPDYIDEIFFDVFSVLTVSILYSLVKEYSKDFSVKIEFKGECPKNYNVINKFFGVECNWNASVSSITFLNGDLMKAFCAYNDVLNVMQKNLVCNINNEIKQKTTEYGFKVRDYISHKLNDCYLSDDDILLDLCSLLDISRWTLNRRLKLENTNFKELLREEKVKLACHLLAESDHNVMKVSEMLGFSSQSVFSRFFKDNVGVNPREYRRI